VLMARRAGVEGVRTKPQKERKEWSRTLRVCEGVATEAWPHGRGERLGTANAGAKNSMACSHSKNRMHKSGREGACRMHTSGREGGSVQRPKSFSKSLSKSHYLNHHLESHLYKHCFLYLLTL
jgi:hypothetical protein